MAPPMQCQPRVLSAPPILVPAFLVILFPQELALVEVAVKSWSYPYSFGLMPSVIAVRHPSATMVAGLAAVSRKKVSTG